jgi:ABC-2 type transport system ATP-binding protein
MINVEKLTKSFGPKLAVDHITFSVAKGEVLGFLGPNGAGKSTSMRMITGYLPPTEGTVTIGGFDISENPLEAKRRLGYLPENAPIYSDMSVAGFLSFCAEMRGLYGAVKAEAIDRVVEMCFLNRVMQQSVDTLSKGFRHRTCLAQALIHDPEVLILDEPTDGLDPNQKYEVRSLLRRLGTDKAIIFSTHILEEVEAACTRALIIDQGAIVAIGTPQELKAQSPSAGNIVVTMTGAEEQWLVSQLEALPTVSQCELLSAADSRVTVRLIPKGQVLPELIALAGQSSWNVENIQIDEGRLDDVFRAITLPDTKTPA